MRQGIPLPAWWVRSCREPGACRRSHVVRSRKPSADGCPPHDAAECAVRVSGVNHTLLVGVLATLVAVGASAHVLLSKRDPRAAFGWIAVCLFFPFAGPILYLLFGRKPHLDPGAKARIRPGGEARRGRGPRSGGIRCPGAALGPRGQVSRHRPRVRGGDPAPPARRQPDRAALQRGAGRIRRCSPPSRKPANACSCRATSSRPTPPGAPSRMRWAAPGGARWRCGSSSTGSASITPGRT